MNGYVPWPGPAGTSGAVAADDLRALAGYIEARDRVAARRACGGCGRSGGELTENGCPECGPTAEITHAQSEGGTSGD